MSLQFFNTLFYKRHACKPTVTLISETLSSLKPFIFFSNPFVFWKCLSLTVPSASASAASASLFGVFATMFSASLMRLLKKWTSRHISRSSFWQWTVTFMRSASVKKPRQGGLLPSDAANGSFDSRGWCPVSSTSRRRRRRRQRKSLLVDRAR